MAAAGLFFASFRRFQRYCRFTIFASADFFFHVAVFFDIAGLISFSS